MVGLLIIALVNIAVIVALILTSRWGGWKLALGLGLAYYVAVTFMTQIETSMDSPDQGAIGIAVSSVDLQGNRVVLEVQAISGQFSGEISEDGESIAGEWQQAGQAFPLVVERADRETLGELPRPQHPEPPYPYAEEEVVITGRDGGVSLAGTLTLPQGNGPHPGVVLIPGSGAHTRDLDIMGHKPFLVLADHLTRHGIAVLRYDERGVGGSAGDHSAVTSEHLARDAAEVMRYLGTRDDIDAANTGYLGLSEGGILAPMAHVEHESAAFLVLLAAPGVTGAEIILEQSALIAEAQGASREDVETTRALQHEIMEILRTQRDSTVLARQLGERLTEEGLQDDVVQAQVQMLTSPWYRFFIQYDPVSHLRQIDVPVLALYGEKDLQVSPMQNMTVVQTALEESPAQDITVQLLPGLNHLFQSADTGAPTEYGQITTTIDRSALEAVTEWIQARAMRGQ